MTEKKPKQNIAFDQGYLRDIKPLVRQFPWVLRITEHKGKPAPIMVVKGRFSLDGTRKNGNKNPGRFVLKEMGMLYGQSQRRCLSVVRAIIGRVCSRAGIPLELQRFLSGDRLSFRGNLPLDEEAGAKLALIFKLQERVRDMDRTELIAWRVERFSREEAIYWLTRVTQYSAAANRWAQAGMRTMLGGQPGDKDLLPMLERLRR
jgi:hypothetical protein